MQKKRVLYIVSILTLLFLISPVLAADKLQVWQGQYHTGNSFNTGTYEFNFTVYDDLTGGNSCYTNTTDLTTGTWGEWKTKQENVLTSCNNISKDYYLNINIDGTDQTPRRRLTMLNYLRNDNTLTVTSDGKTGIGTSNPSAPLHVSDNKDSSDVNVALFENLRTTPANNDEIGIPIKMNNNVKTPTLFSEIRFIARNTTNGSEEGAIQFDVSHNGSLGEAMIMNAEEIVVNENSLDRNFRIEGATEENALFIDGVTGKVGVGTRTPEGFFHLLSEDDTASHTIARFDWNSSTPKDNDSMFIDYRTANDAGILTEFFRQTIQAEKTQSGSEHGSLLFEVIRNGSLETVMKLNTKEIVINEDGTNRNFRIETIGSPDAFTINGANGQIGLGATPLQNVGVLINPPSQTIPGNQNFARTYIRTTGSLTAGGAHDKVNSLWIEEPKIAGGGSVTDASTLYIENAPTEGTNNYAIFSDSGLNRFDGPVKIQPTSSSPTNPEEEWMYYDSDLHEPCYYNSTDWVQFDGGGTCS